MPSDTAGMSSMLVVLLYEIPYSNSALDRAQPQDQDGRKMRQVYVLELDLRWFERTRTQRTDGLRLLKRHAVAYVPKAEL